jgi:Zn-dependent protease with chaperone function
LTAVKTKMATAAAAQAPTMVLDAWPWGVLTAVAAFFCAMAVQRMAGGIALRPLRRGAPGHWTEKARLAHPGWVILSLGQIFQPFLWIMVVGAVPDKRGLGVVPLVGLAAFVGAGVASARMESRVRQRPVSMLDWARAWAVGIVFFAHWVVFGVLVGWLPDRFNWAVVWLVLAYVGLVLALSLGGTLALARWTGLLRPAPERLQAIVDLAVQRMGDGRPVACVLRWKAANALAFPFGRVVAVTDMALNSCTDEELAAICSHELAHLNEPRRIRFARLAGRFVWLPLLLLRPLCGALGNQAGVLVALGSLLVARVLVRRMVLALEKRADSAGRAHEGEAGTYARALEKLYQINLMPAVTRSWLPTHPHLYDRLLAAGITPDYPRPKPPSRWRASFALAFLLLAALFCGMMWMGFVQAVQGPGPRAQRGAHAARVRPQGRDKYEQADHDGQVGQVEYLGMKRTEVFICGRFTQL